MRLVGGELPESRFEDLWNQWQESRSSIVASTLLYYEVSNALHRLAVAGQLRPEHAEQALADALSLNIRLYSDADLHQRALNQARQLTLPATYDAH